MNTKYWILALISVICFSASAQQLLTLEEAIKIALEENYSIKVAKNEVTIAENSTHPGKAGLLPTLDLNGNYQYGKNNTTQQFVGQEPNEINGAVTTSYGTSLDLGYTLFDGLGNVYNYKKLKSSLALANAQTRAEIELTIMDIISAYYGLAR
ncbi:MAG: TolC family protein, partial [Cyclobacteriaceae bacterium]